MLKMTINVMVSLIVLTPLVVLLHEGGHMLSAYIFYGATSHLYFPLNWDSLACVTDYSTHVGALVGYAGGFLVFFILIGLFFILRKKYYWTSLIMLIYALANLCYGFYEGYIIHHSDEIYISYGLWAVSLILFGVFIRYVVKSFDSIDILAVK